MIVVCDPTESDDGWLKSEGDIQRRLEEASICSDNAYLRRRLALPGDLRLLADRLRFDYGCSRFSGQPVSLAHFCPPEFHATPVSDLDLTTRAANGLERAKVRTVGDLRTLTELQLKKTDAVGKKTVSVIYEAIRKSCAEFLSTPLRHDATDSHSPTVLARGETRPLFTEPQGKEPLVIWFRGFLARVPERTRAILEDRLGLNGKVLTLQAIADKWGVTRERIRQIEAKAIRRERDRNQMGTEVIRRIDTLLLNREQPLLLVTIQAEDAWFAGFDAAPITLGRLIEALSDDRYKVLDVDGLAVVSRASSDDYDAAKQASARWLQENVARRPRRSEVEVIIQAIARQFRCPELWQSIAGRISERCQYSQEPDPALLSFGTSVESLATAVLESSAEPLHYTEIHRRLEQISGRKIDVRRAHNAAAEVGLLLGRGTYGTLKHVPLSEAQMADVAGFIESVILNGRADRQWHCTELVDEIAASQIAVPEYFDHYMLNALLQSKARDIAYLGRLVWTKGENTGSSKTRERLDIQQAILSLLRSADGPLTTDELRERLEHHRGLGHYFQIHPEGELVKLDVNRWGLLGRDAGLTEDLVATIFDAVEQHLDRVGHGMIGSELADYVGATFPGCTRWTNESFWLALAGRDRRFRVSVGGLLWLRRWESPRRLSVIGAVSSVVNQANYSPKPVAEIAALASAAAQRQITSATATGALRVIGATYSESAGGWLAPHTSEDSDGD